MKRLPYLMWVLLVVACSSINCPVNNVVSAKYQVLDQNGVQLKLTDTLTVTSARKDGTDTILLNRGIDISKFSLLMSYSHPEDILVFHFDNNNNDNLHVKDTVWVKKEDIPHFESVDCNANFFHTLTGVRFTHNYIDSIVIINTSVTYDTETVHFSLYPKSSN